MSDMDMPDTGLAPVEPVDDINNPGFWEKNESLFLGFGFIALMIIIWQLVPSVFTLSKGMKLFFATPTMIVGAFGDLIASGKLWPALQFSASAFGLGLGLSRLNLPCQPFLMALSVDLAPGELFIGD